jgi:hypothetical protein
MTNRSKTAVTVVPLSAEFRCDAADPASMHIGVRSSAAAAQIDLTVIDVLEFLQRGQALAPAHAENLPPRNRSRAPRAHGQWRVTSHRTGVGRAR